jgi:PEP-CTERM motif
MNATCTRLLACLAIFAASTILATQSQADPLPGRDLLKFSQLPMNQTTIADTSGVVVGVYGGHDELSTAYGFVDPNGLITDYNGRFMADDFADNLSSPVVHIKWWGSYLNDNNAAVPPQPRVKNFLIAFESDVPAPVPGFSRPGQVLQADVVTSAAAISGPGSGEFTEKLIRGPDPILGESLYEYNAELHLGHEFFEQKDTVYWLKIAALVDVPAGINFPVNMPPLGITQWGWHNRDYTIQDAYASPVPVPGEYVDGMVGANNVYHFQDDAVTGDLRYTTISGVPNFGIFQPPQNMSPTFYMGGTDGPITGQIPGQLGIDFHSKDLAFNLYTTVPEPTTGLLMAIGLAGMFAARRRTGVVVA